jgi:hypothetical protein
VAIPFQEGLEGPVERFFHLYEAGEMAGEARAAGLDVALEVLDAENWFLTGRARSPATGRAASRAAGGA